MISVIVTTFNREKRLKKAIKSILKQTYLKIYPDTQIQIVIVDDHSTDGTEKYCEKLRRKYFGNNQIVITYIRLKENFGQHTKPKNIGIANSLYDLIAFLDDDNEYLPDHLQVLWKAMEDTDLDCVYGDRWLIDETKEFPKTIGIRGDWDLMKLMQANYIDTSDVLVKKQAMLDVGGWDETLPKFADWNLWMRMGKAGKTFKRVPVPITNYLLHKGSNIVKQAKVPMPFDTVSCPVVANEKKNYKVAIFTITFNRLEFTKQMYKTMTEKAGYEFDWFVVDNNSTDGTREWLRGKTGGDIFNEENVGISKASNQALDILYADYDIIIKVDNDCKFLTDNWLAEIVDVISRNHKAVVSPYVEGLVDHPGGVPRDKTAYIDKHVVGIVRHLGGICIAAHKMWYDDFRWEEDDFLHGEQDLFFSQYVMKKRGMLVYEENIKVEHMDNSKHNLKERVTRYESKADSSSSDK